jgi:hypothetical protein
MAGTSPAVTLYECPRLEYLPIKKRASRPPSSNSFSPTRRPGGARLHPGKEHAGYFFFAAFLAFFFVAFFAFFAFLAIVSSQGFMVKRDTRDARRRASLATSSVTNSADSQVSALCCHIRVIPLSTAEMRFQVIFARESALQRAPMRWRRTPTTCLTI